MTNIHVIPDDVSPSNVVAFCGVMVLLKDPYFVNACLLSRFRERGLHHFDAFLNRRWCPCCLAVVDAVHSVEAS